MDKKKVFLLQDTNEQNAQLRELFAKEENFELVGESTDGDVAIEFVKDKKPDVFILELVLSGHDGLSVIAKVKEFNVSTKIIVLSALKRDEIISMAIDAGADYFMAKPFNFEFLKERIINIFEKENACSDKTPNAMSKQLDEKLGNLFINVGIPPHIKGYSFLREGVKMAIFKPEIINNITKQLYPKIGEKFDTTASKVERAIRHAIEVAWNRGRIDNINNILGVRAFVGKEKPTNGEFIALVADKMILDLG